jgi:hypothetical protein
MKMKGENTLQLILIAIQYMQCMYLMFKIQNKIVGQKLLMGYL